MFQGLQPGTYYLKPLLREHSFDPPVAHLQLADGEQKEVALTAVRTAWGISGAVKSSKCEIWGTEATLIGLDGMNEGVRGCGQAFVIFSRF